MPSLAGLPPIENPAARLLVLGSMPGAASLRSGRYYGHPQNLFWVFMGRLVGAGPSLPYAQRIERLVGSGVALWDVIASCEREGSLDSAIRDARANDFGDFFARHPRLRLVAFNGAAAEQTFLRHVPATTIPAGTTLHRLPSTSPANRQLDTESKFAEWRAAFVEAGIHPLEAGA
ncbi:DNA-deoxyinosine glycosylase [Lysobacter humi (ex Lee et al. 2017)]